MGKHILEAYEKQRKLCKEEKQLLHVLLLFPEKFWKVSNHYSNSHKAWVSGRDIEKIKPADCSGAGKGTFSGKFVFFSVKNELY